ncbi:MAG: hypothetical protein M0Z66_13045 [Thermaerobacter sp.]|nr:hypothetical protein [Thermaerobacter sp.]
MVHLSARVKLAAMLHDERGVLSTYLAKGILALAALSLTGAVMFAFSGAGQKGPDIFTLTTRGTGSSALVELPGGTVLRGGPH